MVAQHSVLFWESRLLKANKALVPPEAEGNDTQQEDVQDVEEETERKGKEGSQKPGRNF